MYARWVGIAAGGAALGLATAAVVIRTQDVGVGAFDWADLGTFLTFALVGSLLVAKLPRNPVGWLLALAGIVVLATHTADAYVSSGATPFAVPGGPVAQWVALSAWPYVMTILAVILLVFPNGRAASRRWRIYLWSVVMVGIVVSTVNAITAWPERGRLLEGETMPPGLVGNLLQVGAFFLVASIAIGGLGLVLRYRRARGVERAQLKLLALAMLFLVVAIALGMLADVVGAGSQVLTETLGFIGLAGIPVSIAVAVTRYRLYDIDRVISRTVTYAALTVVLVGVYVAGVVGVGRALQGVTGGAGGDLLVAATTLVVAALFQPARRRIQRFVDRRFNRSRYDAQRTVETFSQRLRSEVDLESLAGDLRRVVEETIHPRSVGLWLPEEAMR